VKGCENRKKDQHRTAGSSNAAPQPGQNADEKQPGSIGADKIHAAIIWRKL
jgi:hypothetical protein